jgi:hypothetical protein
MFLQALNWTKGAVHAIKPKMMHRLLSSFIALPLLVCSGLVTRQLHAADGKPAGRAIDISEAAISEVTSNLHQLNGKQNGLKQLEEDLFKPLKKPFSARGSLDAILITPPMRHQSEPVIPSKKAREKMEQQKNWVFMSPDDFAEGPSMEEIFNIREFGPDGKEREKRSAVERYYDSLDRKANGETNGNKAANGERYNSQRVPQVREEDKSQERARPKPEVPENESALKRLFESNAEKNQAGPGGSHGTLSDIFGLGETKPSAEWTKAHKERLDEFKQMLALPSPSASADSVKSLPAMDSISKPLKTFGGLDGSFTPPPRSTFDFSSGAINPPRSPAGVSDSFGGFGQSSLTPAFPKFEPPKLAPPLPNFNTPKRAF